MRRFMLVFALILANAAAFAWWQGALDDWLAHEREPEIIARQFEPDAALVLPPERLDAAQRAATLRCREAGPIADDRYERALAWARDPGRKLTVVEARPLLRVTPVSTLGDEARARLQAEFAAEAGTEARPCTQAQAAAAAQSPAPAAAQSPAVAQSPAPATAPSVSQSPATPGAPARDPVR